jgi:hypothetical protein
MNSSYTLTFPDGTTTNSNDIGWQEISSKVKVTRNGKVVQAYVSFAPISSIYVSHNGLEKSLDVPHDCGVFQSVTARTTFIGDTLKTEEIGRTIGLVKDNIVIEEYNLSSETNSINGFKL